MPVDKDKMKAVALAATPEHEFTADERRLYDLMSEISEDCYCAGWMHGNEFALWDAITTGDLRYGMGEIDRALLAQVAALSIKTGKWIVWRDDNDGLDPHDTSEWGPYAVDLKEWLGSHAENDKLTQERDELRAEVERMKAALGSSADICEHRAMHWQQFEGTYDAGKKAGALDCAAAIREAHTKAGKPA